MRARKTHVVDLAVCSCSGRNDSQANCIKSFGIDFSGINANAQTSGVTLCCNKCCTEHVINE